MFGCKKPPAPMKSGNHPPAPLGCQPTFHALPDLGLGRLIAFADGLMLSTIRRCGQDEYIPIA
jgi:hypothetical protein